MFFFSSWFFNLLGCMVLLYMLFCIGLLVRHIRNRNGERREPSEGEVSKGIDSAVRKHRGSQDPKTDEVLPELPVVSKSEKGGLKPWNPTVQEFPKDEVLQTPAFSREPGAAEAVNRWHKYGVEHFAKLYAAAAPSPKRPRRKPAQRTSDASTIPPPEDHLIPVCEPAALPVG